MIKYRGITPGGKVVEGYWIPNLIAVPMIDGTVYHYHKVLPQSLAMSTGIFDKNKVEIFGSFPVDGVMSEGGDEIIATGSGVVGAPAYPTDKLPKLKVAWSGFGAWSTKPVDMDYAIEYEKNHPLDDAYTAGHFLCHFHSIEVIPKEQDNGR